MHKKSWRQGKCIFNLIRFLFLFFWFFFISTFGRVTLSRSSFIQQIYFFLQKKTTFFHFQHYIFFNTFYSRHVSFFFANFHLITQKMFFFSKENGCDTHFSDFSSFHFFYSSKTLSYYEKGTEWKTIFLYFFQEFETHFFDFDKSQFFQILMKS